ncbi:hypothetical protein FNV43_RR07956 [Rhamnella rubrinervis]|uniref:Uncharacterized protein n=1 Tax=Rhamnella rubrinervis TaxID=2594499 RepID=A0A8K0HHJ1_9ROSA|nr:hypothetical protein FNV43_RR07956 [Rhamnella rubrinervis]
MSGYDVMYLFALRCSPSAIMSYRNLYRKNSLAVEKVKMENEPSQVVGKKSSDPCLASEVLEPNRRVFGGCEENAGLRGEELSLCGSEKAWLGRRAEAAAFR